MKFFADLVRFTEEILNGKLHFLCRDTTSGYLQEWPEHLYTKWKNGVHNDKMISFILVEDISIDHNKITIFLYFAKNIGKLYWKKN